MRWSLALALPVVLLLAGVASSGTFHEACRGGDTDTAAIGIDDDPKARVEREAKPGGFYVTPAGTPSDPRTWRETNAAPGLQKTDKVCDVSEWDGGTTWTLRYTYVKFRADTPIEEPEQAVP